MTLHKILSKSTITKDDNDKRTNTRMPEKDKELYGGNYNIQDYDDFLKQYYNYIFIDENTDTLTEKQLLDDGPLLVDIDLHYNTSITERQHTKEHIIDIIMEYAECLSNTFIDINSSIMVYVMEKQNVNCLDKKTKDGIHLLFGIKTPRFIQKLIRNKILNRIQELWKDLPISNTWNDVLDEKITNGTSPWQLYGSCKPDHQVYKVTYQFELSYTNSYWENKEIPFVLSLESFKKLSARYNDNQSFTFIKEETLPRIRLSSTKVSIPDSDLKIYIELGIKYEIFIKMSKGSNRNMWINIGFLIKNTIGDCGEDLFVDISRHDSKFVEDEVRNCYKGFGKFHKYTEKKPLSIASLIKYYKDTDKDIAKVIIKEALKLIKKTEVVEETNDDNFELDPTKLEDFDSDYCNSFAGNYKTQKKYFEHFVCKVLCPEPQFIYVEGKKDIGKNVCIYSRTSIIIAFEHIRTDNITHEKIINGSFVSEWLKDPKIKQYNRIDFNPVNDINGSLKDDKTIYNLFQGYNPKIKTEFNKEKQQTILKPFLDITQELCGGIKKDMEYFIKFIAQMIQKPTEKVPIAFIIKGKQGTGKTMILNTIGSVVGQKHYISSSNPKDFFGDYAEGFYHKLLVNLNECEGKNTFDFEGKIKSFISEDKITINPKNVRPSEVNNNARVIVTTNKANPIPLDVKSGDRRWVVFHSTDVYLDKKYGTIFWTKVLEHFKKPEFIACLYDYLNTMDISKVDWRSERPITEAYKQMCKLYVPIEALFFEDYCNNSRGCLIPAKDDIPAHFEGSTFNIEKNPLNKEIYDAYVIFCKSNGFANDKRFTASISNFNSRCEEIEIPHKVKKTNGYNEFIFTPKEVYNYLIKKKFINRDVDDPEVVLIDEQGEDVTFEI
jgi:hypothetical protein